MIKDNKNYINNILAQKYKKIFTNSIIKEIILITIAVLVTVFLDTYRDTQAIDSNSNQYVFYLILLGWGLSAIKALDIGKMVGKYVANGGVFVLYKGEAKLGFKQNFIILNLKNREVELNISQEITNKALREKDVVFVLDKELSTVVDCLSRKEADKLSRETVRVSN